MDKTDIPGTFNAGATLGQVNETNMARIWNKHKQTNTPLKRKVFVGLSGGVDSSVSAALLRKTGYAVTGVFIRVWQPLDEASGKPFFECSWKDDRLDAMRVCATLGIPFRELNLEKEYKKEVVDYMIREYRAGRTPNPDVFCNRFIKFGAFYEFARKSGADFIATGHYARIRIVKDKGLRIKDFGLLTGSDPQKDQSYFLWQIRKEQLPHILFPVGGMKKPEVRKLAKKFGLITAEKKDSQGLCFVGKVDMKEFLKRFIKTRKGRVLSEKGEIVGEHDGAAFYTIGERIGAPMRLNLKSGKRFNLKEPGPFYVIEKNISRNTITVSHKTPSGALPHTRTEIIIKNCNWLAKPKSGRTYSARVRYRQPLQKCRIMNYESRVKGRSTIHNSEFIIQFTVPQTVAPGQSLVVYDGAVLIGGGIIC